VGVFLYSYIFLGLVIGGLSLWNGGFWMKERSGVPNFTAISMVLLVISQVLWLRAGLKKGD
jgi:hypothetical protein